MPWAAVCLLGLVLCGNAGARQALPLGGCLVLAPEASPIHLPAGVRQVCLERGRRLDAVAWKQGLEPLVPLLSEAHALAMRRHPGRLPEVLVLYHQRFPHAATLQTEEAVFILVNDGLIDRLERAVGALLADWAPRLALDEPFPDPGLEDWLEILRTPLEGGTPLARPEPAGLRDAPRRLAAARPYLAAALAFVLQHERMHAYSRYRTCGYRGLDPLALEAACDRLALGSFQGAAEQDRMALAVLSWLVSLGYQERYWQDRIREAASKESPFGPQQDLLAARRWLHRAQALHALWQDWPRERHWPRALEGPLKRYLFRLLQGRAPVPASKNPPECRKGLRIDVDASRETGAARITLASEKEAAVDVLVEIQWRTFDEGSGPPRDSEGRHYRVLAHAQHRMQAVPMATLRTRLQAEAGPQQAGGLPPGLRPVARIVRCTRRRTAIRSPLFLEPSNPDLNLRGKTP